MTYTGNIQKMGALADEQGRVHYTLQMGGDQLDMNALLGKELEITFLGEIYCKSCGKRTGKSYAQGFCFQCMQTAPEAEECVLRRSEEHTSELQSRPHLVCRLLLEK